MPNEQFVHDLATAQLELDSDEGIDWDEVEVVTIDNPPHEEAFGTDQFYKIPTTVTREIAQPYLKGGTVVTMKKPADELKQAAWSLDNRPITLDHPDTPTGAVKSMDQIHGFVRDPRFDEEDAIQRANSYIPTNNEIALDWIESGGDEVSPGFRHEEVVANDDDVDGYQTDIVYDHLALVKQGRCSREDGCGLTADSDEHGRIFTNTSNNTDSTMSDNDCNCGGDGGSNGFAVDSLSLDAIAAKHDGVQEVIDERDELATDVDELQETVDEKEEQLEAAKTTVDELKEELSEYRESEKEVVVDSITDLTPVWDEESLMDLELDTLEDRLELAKDMAADVNDVDVTGDSGSDVDEGSEEVEGSDYEYGGVYDLSHTA